MVKGEDMDKFINKENIFIVVAVSFCLVQSNYFATKLDVANLKLEMMQFTSTSVEHTESKLDKKLDALNIKLDTLLKGQR